MKKRVIEKVGDEVSLLGFGCMRFPEKNGVIDREETARIIDYAYKNGVNYYDTAYVYNDGESEKAMGAALKRYPRESFFMADKMPVWCAKNKDDLEKIFNRQLERLGTDYIDFYLVHSLDKEHWEQAKKLDVIGFLTKKREQGKLRHIGFSFHDSPELFREIADYFDWDFVQIQLNYMDWKNQRADEIYAYIEQKKLSCIVMEPVRGGGLANFADDVGSVLKKAAPDKSYTSWALRWVAQKPRVRVILSGMSDFEQVRDNIATLSDAEPLNETETKALRKAIELINSRPQIGCTGCHYCMPCPHGVQIPDDFATYNNYMKYGVTGPVIWAFMEKPDMDKCVNCGACVKKCPQHIDIPHELLKVAKIRKEQAK